MVARKPMPCRGMHPARQVEIGTLAGDALFDIERGVLDEVFRTAGDLDGVLARRKRDRFAVGPIDLVMKEKIGSQPAGPGLDKRVPGCPEM